MQQLFLTLVVGAAAGFLCFKLKMPGGMMVGALIGVAALNIGTGLAVMPVQAKVAAQVMAGAFIGCSVERDDLRRMPKLIRPALILLGSMLVLNLGMGVVVHGLTDLDWLTAFLCAVPGGTSDVPIIAAEMGAKAGDVAAAQFFRLVAGVGLFPSVIMAVTKNEPVVERECAHREVSKDGGVGEVVLTLGIAAVCGVTGRALGVPVGALLFAMLGVLAFKLLTARAFMPMWLKRVAQILSGAYVGSSIGLDDLVDMRMLILPILLLVFAYFVNCLWVSALLHRFCGFTRREAMLIATPAGASDMALISGDLNVHNPDLMVLQITRMIIVIAVFPQIIGFVVRFL